MTLKQLTNKNSKLQAERDLLEQILDLHRKNDILLGHIRDLRTKIRLYTRKGGLRGA